MSHQDVVSLAVPKTRLFEDTAEHVSADILRAQESGDDTTAALAKVILTAIHNGGDGGGPGNGDKVLKDIKRHKWLAGLIALILGPGGMVGTYYAIRDRSIANEEQVDALTKQAAKVQPAIQKNTDAIKSVSTEVSSVNGQLTDIADGIESLKQVNINKLEKENEKLEQELRRIRNRR